MAPAFPEPAGIGERDGGKHGRGILPPQLGEDAAKPTAQIRLPAALGRRRQRRAEQENAEIGVAAGGAPAAPHRPQDALADRQGRIRQGPGAGDGAGLEIGDAHAMAFGEDMDIAGLQGLKLGPAGGEIGRADPGPGQALNGRVLVAALSRPPPGQRPATGNRPPAPRRWAGG